MAQKYNAIFFDLDHTLWDFEANSTATLHELINRYNLFQRIQPQAFIDTYQQINLLMWQQYYQHQISKADLRVQRFEKTLAFYGIYDFVLANQLSIDYLNICPHKGQLFPQTHEVLQQLQSKYSLYLITNGFSEVQQTKISASKLNGYFKHCVISEEVGFLKPSPQIFYYTMQLAKVTAKQCLMVGDNYDADIVGAANVGIDTVLFNAAQPNQMQATYQIQELKQLLQII